MNQNTYDPRDIPILTEAIDVAAPAPAPSIDATALRAAIVENTLQLADSLTSQAAKDIETLLYERVFGQLRAQLPELVERLIREQLPGETEGTGEPDG
jgi:hypothetical protein